MLWGNGDGTFNIPVNYGVVSFLIAIIATDFNEDGKQDLAVTNYHSSSVSVLLGNGDGTFQSPINYNVGNAPALITAADFNGDSKLHLIKVPLQYLCF